MNNDPWQNARLMYARDNCARSFGIEVTEMAEGEATVTMTVSDAMLNGHQTCQGGQLFTLADTAFAYACNSQGLTAVASGCSIHFVRPALFRGRSHRLGSTLSGERV